ncbi:XTP/dITP diphosphohydrolase [Paenibacillus shirakamiensis]|uniref:dITP/XTP pyrophosphatase n=1 Tax=Paenibacillus shirakamiensis TaxID=1265935 RepID=A0ABS4JFF7_9BACL|nr:XTP/dITP diphosphatase [Paenibacillus shirakamiensis]MBP2000443.1 XTP/dITP diphosphohydrolase [Paenibacillus shirakamiensis]
MTNQTKQVLIVATGNSGKVKEFVHALSSQDTIVKSMADYPDIPEVIEDGLTFAENARKKAKTVGDVLGLRVLADDSGLCVDQLEGRPGVYSARYAGEHASDAENNEKLLHDLAELSLGEDTEQPLLSPARFVCHLALYDPATGEFTEAEGTVEGMIVSEPVGQGGFGYDPLFYLSKYDKTMAQLTMQEKQAISHRGEALRLLQQKLGIHPSS